MRATRPGLCVIGVIAALLTLGACGASGDDSASQSAPSGAAGSAAPVMTRAVDGVGTILANADGMTLYVSDPEKDGTIKCVDGCADFWLPVQADSAPASIPGVSGTLGVVSRPDGSKQLTLDGQPLYTFSQDHAPGSAKGDGFEDDFQGTHFKWHVISSDGSAAGTATSSSGSGSDGDSGGGYGY